MLRKLILLAVVAGIIGLALFWFLTIPATVPASALGAHTPNVENGKTMFIRGRLRIVPRGQRQARRLHAARRRARAAIAVRHLLCAEHFLGPEGRHRRLDRSTVRHRDGEGHVSATAAHYFPAFPYTSYHRMALADRARPVRLS